MKPVKHVSRAILVYHEWKTRRRLEIQVSYERFANFSGDVTSEATLMERILSWKEKYAGCYIDSER